ncbi:DEBR0S1_26632g1_1 [Brettanomyces bruxellensis]|uniref:DEBR0S1_26632g1_1 n=1 Tax=Dekkera bruxellensis TaxID=5007 RepID=A0A7D9GZU2_DEKBR|nr:DEBR0S1_26632g1_1 [Brettanomyces bruxellensis]
MISLTLRLYSSIVERKETDMDHFHARSDIPIDCGTFKTLDNGVREETGKMKNESTGNFESYIEHWITLDPLKSTPTNMLPLQVVQDGSLNYALFDILENKQNFEGRFIRLGVWAQGLLWDKKNLEFPISIVRLHLNNKNWDIIISFGRRVPFFKSLASTEVHNGEIVKNFDVIWTCLEAGII